MPRGRQSKANKRSRNITLKRCQNHLNTKNAIGEKVTYHKKSIEAGHKERFSLHPVTHKGHEYFVSMFDGKPIGVAKVNGGIRRAADHYVSNIQVRNEVITKYYSSICKV
jgi:hypothetical protein